DCPPEGNGWNLNDLKHWTVSTSCRERARLVTTDEAYSWLAQDASVELKLPSEIQSALSSELCRDTARRNWPWRGRGMRCDLVADDAVFYVLLVRQPRGVALAG